MPTKIYQKCVALTAPGNTEQTNGARKTTEKKQKKGKEKAPPLVPYTEPQLNTKSKSKDGGPDWFVWFRFYHNGEWTKNPIRDRGNLNRIKDKTQRRKAGEALRDAIKNWLERGWNPILDPEYKLRNVLTKNKRRGFLNQGETMPEKEYLNRLEGKESLPFEKKFTFNSKTGEYDKTEEWNNTALVVNESEVNFRAQNIDRARSFN